jgi:NAD(P)H-quinone oxidoreductase subunit 5
MTDLTTLLMITPAVALIAAVAVTSAYANRHHRLLRRGVILVAAIQLVAASIAAIAWLVQFLGQGVSAHHLTLLRLDDLLPIDSSPIGISVHYDGVSALMLLLVSFVGWVICRYSLRYLDGEPCQGRYFRWTAVTLGAVSLMVVSGNLLMFFALWVLTSLGLHQLLLHYGDRPAAARAAWKKFAVSRMGDVALVAAIVLIYRLYGTYEFDQLFAAAGAIVPGDAAGQLHVGETGTGKVIAWLIMFGAVTKSAQLPFHSWLPLTMETPTPVSALMHAGIVNAGGYLIVRTHPLVIQSPTAMATLAVIGALTASFAAVVMLTQTSIKKSLAYSTIAQMGFMMLQCGLGAFSAAMLHIVAHSLYKANAFLASGTVITDRDATRMVDVVGGPIASVSAFRSVLTAVASLAIAAGALVGLLGVLGITPSTKPGGYLLGFTLCLALTFWLMRVFASGRGATIGRGIAATFGLVGLYAVSFYAVDKVVSPSIAAAFSPNVVGGLGVVAVVVGCFIAMFVLHLRIVRGASSWSMQALYVHASNGFYIDSMIRRAVRPLVS